MKYRHKDLLTLLISLFIFSACENPTGVGLEISPDEVIEALFTDTISVNAFTMKDDSAQSGGFSQSTFGVFNDPVFGKTVSDLAFDLSRPEGFVQFKDDVVIDSVVLVLPFANAYYGDTTSNSKFSLQVRQLDEVFTFNNFTTKTWNVSPEVLGTRTLNRYPYKGADSILLFKHINERDTLVKVGPQLRMTLSKDFFKTLLGPAVDSATLSTVQGFRNHVKGLYLSVDTNLSQGIGGMVNLTAVSGISGVEITYRQSNGKTGDDAGTDTIRTIFPIHPFGGAGASAPQSMTTSIQTTYKAEIKEQLDAEGQLFERIYLHAPSGLRGKVVLPFIDELKGKGLLINKAELVLYVDEEQMDGPFNLPSPRLTLYREDIAGRRQNIPDGSALNAQGFPMDERSFNYLNFGGWYNKEKKRYIFHLTSYIQDVLRGKINGNELYIAPVSISDQYVPVNPALNTSSRVVLGNSSSPTYKMKLNLYYKETGHSK